ncbi:MAG: Gfo/Idh/MocA family oxidoreductase [Candidatus Sumerlaeota bacterium]|nr:Gfo/Idh/MocA family oxidoreductase [Candidatus Sumerlaeota bacterium]
MLTRKRYAQVGLGGRHFMYREAVTKRFSQSSEMVGVCDVNEGRLKLALESLREKDNLAIPGYKAEDFDRMIAETRPDCVIVTSMDRTHDHYICRAMELGCDVITEKPMTIDAQRCQRILDTRRQTGCSLRVTFNYRYSPPRTQIKDLLMSGVIGEIQSVDFHWMLDTSHGADYYRRWHRRKENSGGLMVHKATHHFDLVNWWLGTVPESVFARGRRSFYRPETAERMGLTHRSERCHTCPEAERCAFCLKMKDNESLRQLYLDCERYDGYYRDQCVFSDAIDIEDSMNLVVAYRNGALMSYSLNSFMPWEGYIITFNGSQGRIEHKCEESVYINADGTVPGALKREGTWTRIYPHRAPAYSTDIWQAEGGHGGGDEPLVEDIFSPDPAKDKYLRAADHRAGAWSILTGIAANHSMRENRPILISELIQGLELPDYP